jgi:IclR family transcriptional regulator, KDG regulon repressor
MGVLDRPSEADIASGDERDAERALLLSERTGSSGLRRDLALLQALTSDEARQRGGLGVMRLAEMLQRDKSQVSRALRALEQAGLVERDPSTREYRIGWLVFGLAARAGDARLLQAAPTVMRELVGQLGESVHLCVLHGNQVLTVLTEAPGHAFRAAGWIGRTFPAYCSSAGRVLLSDNDYPELLRRFKSSTFEALGPCQLVRNVDDLDHQVQIARQQGYAIVREEFEVDLVGVSAPVRDFRRQIVAALNVSAPRFRFDARLNAAGPTTAAAAARLSSLLGYPGHES